MIKTEIIYIETKFKIKYDSKDIESRKEAIKKAEECATGINSWGYPVSVESISAKELKKRE